MSNGTTDHIVVFDRVSKRYRLGSLGSLRGAVSSILSRSDNEAASANQFWAVQEVSFGVGRGESLGIIGPNGAGKTTILKLLSGVTRPSMGRISVRGRLSCLIELGAGFHPELSGLENIYLNGAILGLKRQEISRKLDAIIAFSELERFIDTPVKRYSSGMYVRLGFAVAAHAEPEVLLVDEVLAVGDASFRHRCMQRMRSLKESGTTIVFVSHNMHQVRDMCDAVLLLAHGSVAARGEPAAVIAAYEQLTINSQSGDTSGKPDREASFFSAGELILKSVAIQPLDTHIEPRGQLASDRPARLRIHYEAGRAQPVGRIDVRVMRDDGTLCSAFDSSCAGNHEFELRNLHQAGFIEIDFDPLQLSTGKYHILVRMTDESDATIIASGQTDNFVVAGMCGVPAPGVYFPLTRWSHRGGDSDQAT